MKIHTFLRRNTNNESVFDIYVKEVQHEDDFSIMELTKFIQKFQTIKELEISDIDSTKYGDTRIAFRIGFSPNLETVPKNNFADFKLNEIQQLCNHAFHSSDSEGRVFDTEPCIKCNVPSGALFGK